LRITGRRVPTVQARALTAHETTLRLPALLHEVHRAIYAAHNSGHELLMHSGEYLM
jgi:hypothetical protein